MRFRLGEDDDEEEPEYLQFKALSSEFFRDVFAQSEPR